jgi:hypothetical protein
MEFRQAKLEQAFEKQSVRKIMAMKEQSQADRGAAHARNACEA